MSEPTIAGEQPLVALRRVMSALRRQETLNYEQWVWCETQRDALMELAITELKATDHQVFGDDVAAILYEVDNVNQLLALSQSRVQTAEKAALLDLHKHDVPEGAYLGMSRDLHERYPHHPSHGGLVMTDAEKYEEYIAANGILDAES